MHLQVGIVGLGEAWEWGYRPALRRLADQFRVVGIYDSVFRRAQLASEEFRAHPAESFRGLIFRPDVTAVLVLGSDWLGPLPVTVACESGKPVFLGAPFELTLSELEELTCVAQTTGQPLMPALGLRAILKAARVPELIEVSLGDPRQIFCYHRMLRWGRGRRSHLAAKLAELIDGCLFLLRQPAGSVVGLSPGDFEECPSGLKILGFGCEVPTPGKAQATVHIVCEWFSKPVCIEGVDFRGTSELHLHCEDGVACFEEGKCLSWSDPAGHHRERLDGQACPEELLLAAFYQAVVSKAPLLADIRDAYTALSLVAKAQESRKPAGDIYRDHRKPG